MAIEESIITTKYHATNIGNLFQLFEVRNVILPTRIKTVVSPTKELRKLAINGETFRKIKK